MFQLHDISNQSKILGRTSSTANMDQLSTNKDESEDLDDYLDIETDSTDLIVNNPRIVLHKLSYEDVQFYEKPPKPLYHSTPKKRYSTRVTKGIAPVRLQY